MRPWSPQELQTLGTPDEVQVSSRRPDGNLRRPTTIWIVVDSDRIFVRSTNGRSAGWFRAALADPAGQLMVGRHPHDVVFAEASEADLPAVDAAYRNKYRRYRSIVDHLTGPGPRAATLQVHPA